MKKKTVIIVSVIIAIVMLISIIVPLALRGKVGSNTGEDAADNTEAVSVEEKNSRMEGAEEMMKESGSSAEESRADKISETSEPESETSVPEMDASGAESSTENISSGGYESGQAGSGGSGGSGSSSKDTDSDFANQESQEQPSQQDQTSVVETPDIPTISFPYTISEADLVIQQISPYNGFYIEDASDKEVSGVAAIVVTNNGSDLEFAGIGISQGERSLAFSASQIPAGATVIIQEQTGASYSSSDPYYSATATTRRTELFEMSEELVKVEDSGSNILTVANISGKKLSEVKVYFKNYLSDDDVYVGGITYNITLTDVEPDTATDVSAGHYDSEYSRIVEVSVKE